ncbi:hypothetical protein JOC77_001856 [Peribacillus deserti]|uniref:DUF1885 domain-containing protein n=1 Tax=Peribacillus deserti TaxID=673318 RepID=A0ABS2QJF9_9BACI|nr:DUF1885 family protein [Peribacillus deserti]MBM7692426.1 hypothetical protein [Peribacillus deserti]
MSENAYIKLVEGSEQQTVTLDELKEWFSYYKYITSKTGQQVEWNYSSKAFPYEIKETTEQSQDWFYLASGEDRYKHIILGVSKEKIILDDETEKIQSYIQITLPDSSTYGDKGKANEFCKFLAKKLKGELHLFNGRVMYYYPRR